MYQLQQSIDSEKINSKNYFASLLSHITSMIPNQWPCAFSNGHMHCVFSFSIGKFHGTVYSLSHLGGAYELFAYCYIDNNVLYQQQAFRN